MFLWMWMFDSVVCSYIFCVLFATVCHFGFWCCKSMLLRMGVCCMVFVAVVFLFLWVWSKPSWNLPNGLGKPRPRAHVLFKKRFWASKGNHAYPCLAHQRLPFQPWTTISLEVQRVRCFFLQITGSNQTKKININWNMMVWNAFKYFILHENEIQIHEQTRG